MLFSEQRGPRHHRTVLLGYAQTLGGRGFRRHSPLCVAATAGVRTASEATRNPLRTVGGCAEIAGTIPTAPAYSRAACGTEHTDPVCPPSSTGGARYHAAPRRRMGGQPDARPDRRAGTRTTRMRRRAALSWWAGPRLADPESSADQGLLSRAMGSPGGLISHNRLLEPVADQLGESRVLRPGGPETSSHKGSFVRPLSGKIGAQAGMPGRDPKRT